MQLSLKILDGIANSVGLDQTAPWTVWSGSALFAHAILSETLTYEILGQLLYKQNIVVSYWRKNVHSTGLTP